MSNRTPANPRDLSRLPLREEPIGDSTLIENLDGARVQTTCARAGEVLGGPPLANGNVDARQRQLARQHQPGRTAAGDHHRMLRYSPHFRASISAGSSLGRGCSAANSAERAGSCRKSRIGLYAESGKEGVCSFRVSAVDGQALCEAARLGYIHLPTAQQVSSPATRLSQHIAASRASVYRALLDPSAVATWMVPDGMSSHVHEFDPEKAVGSGNHPDVRRTARTGKVDRAQRHLPRAIRNARAR